MSRTGIPMRKAVILLLEANMNIVEVEAILVDLEIPCAGYVYADDVNAKIKEFKESFKELLQ